MTTALGSARGTPRGFWLIAAMLLLLMVDVTVMLWGRATAPARIPPAVANRQALFREIQPLKIANCELQRFGETHDGGYLLCANLLGAVQAGYSYGISGYDGWGCDVSRRLHVPVHQYDCFDLRAPTCPGGSTIFHGECVGTARSIQDARPFDTLANQFAKNDDAMKPVVMKMDVEGAEWDAFLLAPESVFEHIDQLDVEFHHVDEERFVATMRRLKTFFDIAHVHYNNFSCDPGLKPFPSWAFEVLLVSKRIAKTDGTRALGDAVALDAPNNPSWADCQVPG
jgi:hypothetical protein